MLFIKHLIDRLCYQQFRYAALIGLQKDKSKFSWLSRSSMSFRHFLSLVTSLSESQILPSLESPKKVMAERTYCKQGKYTTLTYWNQILGKKIKDVIVSGGERRAAAGWPSEEAQWSAAKGGYLYLYFSVCICICISVCICIQKHIWWLFCSVFSGSCHWGQGRPLLQVNYAAS